MTKRTAGGGSEVAEELRRGVWERIVTEGADGNRAKAVLRAEDGGFRQQQEVTAGKIDSSIARLLSRHISARRAPMFAVQIARRQVEDSEGLNCSPEASLLTAASMARGYNTQEFSERAKFGGFPRETLPDIHGINVPVSLRQLDEHHATVEAAADQSANRGAWSVGL